ncbi:MAG TPA: sensor domain-containing diguanylate cyclase [Desulfurivibrio alkaliphilus]|uniref:diguanylate cyclase n=1 Tax=Desulfurivibrio alkaliphilus TaxID=427923 RepID=A0A7C2XQH1_9BACT|nr:sensor domain-containing diguanylate cyclase [Desulfurivibrio alkaliphilus]
MANLATHHVSLGLIYLHCGEGEAFNKMEKKLLAAVSEQIEITLANARLYRMAITDALTGLYSKRYCETKIRELLDVQTLEQRRTFSVLMLDLDHFKRVNDTHGHQVGDEVLVQLAGPIRSQVRRNDVACRYGGEAFIILVPGEPGTAVEVAERLCRAVEGHTFVCQGGLKLQNTVSIGIASFPRHGRTAGEVIGAADEALYGAKHTGRNRCMVNI